MAKVIITIAEVVEIPDEVYKDLLLQPTSMEEHERWCNASAAVARQYANGKWAYTETTGLVNVKTLGGELLAEA